MRILLRIELPEEPNEDLTGPREPDPEPADVLRLSEKWKTEFATQKIREDRLVILFSKALPGSVSSLETWVIPSGAPLPDPEAIFKDDVDARKTR